jgi:hypothetical protein
MKSLSPPTMMTVPMWAKRLMSSVASRQSLMSAPFLADAPGGKSWINSTALCSNVTIAAEVLPIAVGAIDGHGTERGAEFHEGLNVDERFLNLEAVVLLGVGAFAVLGLDEAGMQVLEVPVEGDGPTVVNVVDAQDSPSRLLVKLILTPSVGHGSAKA